MALSRFILPFADVGEGIKPASGAKLNFYATGTSTRKDTYSDSAGTIPNDNPVIADSTGVFSDIFIEGLYKVVLQDKNGVQQWEADPVTSAYIGDLSAIARSLNVLDSQVIYSTDTVTPIGDGDGVDYIYNAATQTTWGIPAGVGAGETIDSVSGGDLVTSGGSYTLNVVTTSKGEVSVKDFGAKGDWSPATQLGTDDTLAIQEAIQYGLDKGFKVLFPEGEYLYDNSGGKFFIDARANINFTIEGVGFARIIVVGTLNNTYTFDVASKSSRLNFTVNGLDIHYFGTEDDVGGIAVTRNGLDNVSEWGGTCELNHVWLARFTRTNLYLKRNYLSSFTKSVFTGADEGVYDTGTLEAAVVGADSSCIYITGGDPGDPVVDFSNDMKFTQCEFQGAKYGVKGYHIRQTDFDSCVFQYCWIALSNIVDNIHGAFNLGDISLSGTNYFEYIANRALADMEVDDDGTTIIDYGRQSTFSSTAKVEFNAVNTVQLQVITGELNIKLPANAFNPRSLAVIGTDADPAMVEIYSNGIIGANKGVDFLNTTQLSATNNHSTLGAYQNSYSGSFSAMRGSVTDPVFGSTRVRTVEVGRIATFMVFGAVASVQGSGDISVKPERQDLYMQDITNCQILFNFGTGATGYDLPVFAKMGFDGPDQIVILYKDAARSTPLTYADLVFGNVGGSEFCFSASFITGN